MMDIQKILFRKSDPDSESGAVTVDWVVLSATIIGLVLLVLVPVAFSTESTVNGFAAYLAALPSIYGNK